MRVQGAQRNPKLVDTITVNVPSQRFRIHNFFVLDASGSMTGSKYNNAVKGINELLVDITKDTYTDNTVTVVEFEGNRIVRRLTFATNQISYNPMGCGGSTPLNQAVGETLSFAVNERANKYSVDDKILVNVFTDGEENTSAHPYSGAAGAKFLANQIKELETQGVTVTFVGTKEEVQYAVKHLNMRASNTLVHDNTARGVIAAFGATITGRMGYSKSVASGEDVTMDFYTKTVAEDKDETKK